MRRLGLAAGAVALLAGCAFPHSYVTRTHAKDKDEVTTTSSTTTTEPLICYIPEGCGTNGS